VRREDFQEDEPRISRMSTDKSGKNTHSIGIRLEEDDGDFPQDCES